MKELTNNPVKNQSSVNLDLGGLDMGFRLTVAQRPDMSKVDKRYDVVIVGGGPAGLSAALYAARYRLKTIIIAELLGGLVAEAPLVDDYLGLPDTPGNKLVEKFINHVKKYGVPIIIDRVEDVKRENNLWCTYTRLHGKICGYTVIIAVGSRKRKLRVPGEDRLTGRGVSYCATCDGPLFRGKRVVVVGGGNSAFTAALYLASLAHEVILIHRRDQFRAFRVYVEKARNTSNITILTNTVVKEIIGDNRVEAAKIQNTKTGEEKIIRVDGVFVEIGLEPPRDFLEKIGIKVDENGYAYVNVDQSTNLPGVYVAGDASGGPHKYRFEQITTAVAEGAIAADAAFKYILRNIAK